MRFVPKRCLELSERLCRAVVVVALLALPAVGGGCAPASDQVELRLYPCMFGDDQPRSVVVEIVGYDGEGVEVETHEVAFDNISAGVFDDGFATVGYRPGEGVVSADFVIGWSSSPSIGSLAEAEHRINLPMLSVPPLGEVLELGDGAGGGCEPIAEGDGDGDLSGDGDGDMTGDGDGDGDVTGDGDGDGDMTGDGDGDMTGDGDMSGDGDGDMTGDGDGDGDMTGDGDGDMTGDGDGDVSPVMPGDPCNDLIKWGCAPALDGQAGEPLECIDSMYTDMGPSSFVDDCPFCGDDIAVDACANVGQQAYCLCLPDSNPEPCDGAELGCDGDSVRLCFEGNVVTGFCPNCALVGEYYECD